MEGLLPPQTNKRRRLRVVFGAQKIEWLTSPDGRESDLSLCSLPPFFLSRQSSHLTLSSSTSSPALSLFLLTLLSIALFCERRLGVHASRLVWDYAQDLYFSSFFGGFGWINSFVGC